MLQRNRNTQSDFKMFLCRIDGILANTMSLRNMRDLREKRRGSAVSIRYSIALVFMPRLVVLALQKVLAKLSH